MSSEHGDVIKVLDGRIKLGQPARKSFRTSMDSIFLAAAVPDNLQGDILDLGCGVGSAGLSVLWRVPECSLTGIDNQEEFIEIAGKNAERNDMKDRCRFVCADVPDYCKNLHDKQFDCVITNPPYYETGQYMSSPYALKNNALGHQGRDQKDGLYTWIMAAHYALRQKGLLCLIHRADHLDRILLAFGTRFGAAEIFPLHPRSDKAASRVLIRAIKGRKTPVKLYPGLVLHDLDGADTQIAKDVLRHGKPLGR